MAIAITRDMLQTFDVTQSTAAAEGVAPDRLRKFDFSDRIAVLRPVETPLFTFSSKNGRKVPTTDPNFRFLEDRTIGQTFDRTFLLAADVNGGSAVTAGDSYTFTIDKATASVDWLIKNMVFLVRTVADSTAGYAQCSVEIATNPVDAGSTTTFTGKIIDLSETSVSGYNVLADNDECRVIGTSFIEGSGSADVWQEEIEDGFGYCQIFKTAVELSGTALATEFRGYPDKWLVEVDKKMREHKNMMEAAILFGQKAKRNNKRYTEGIIGHIVKNVAPTTNNGDLSYTAGNAYYRSLALGEMIYDRIMQDLEVLNDPAYGTGNDKLVMASRPVMTFFHKIADGAGFTPLSIADGEGRMDVSNFKSRDGEFGHKIVTITTVHGDIHLTENPQLRAGQDRLMVFVDLEHVALRPLVGNGENRDTTFTDNIQAPDEDARKAQWLTEIGFEVTLPENHMLYHLETA